MKSNADILIMSYGREIPLTVVYWSEPGEPPSRDNPGCEGYLEINEVWNGNEEVLAELTRPEIKAIEEIIWSKLDKPEFDSCD